MRTEGLSTQVACRVLEVSESGFYDWRSRPPSARSIRHAWVTDIICQIHHGSRGVYGARRVHAELRLGHRITVGHNAVAMLMRRAGIAGLSGNRRPRRRPRPVDTPVDLVDRNFARSKTGPVVGHRYHRTSHSGRQGVLCCSPGCVQPPGRRLVNRQLSHRGTGHLRPGNGNQQPPAALRNGYTFGSGHPIYLLGVHPESSRIRTCTVDDRHHRRRLLR